MIDKNDIDIKEINKRLSDIVPKQEKLRNELEQIIRELEGDDYE